MTTQCTLIVGFALAGLGADTLAEIGDDQSELCLYKAAAVALARHGLHRHLDALHLLLDDGHRVRAGASTLPM